jgi:hypothetical protein
VNRCLKTYFRCFITDQPKSWVQWLPWAEFWFNTTFHASTGSTPFELVYGRKPPMITRLLQGETRVEAVQKELEERDEALKQLKAQLLRAQDCMKHFADEKRTDRSFQVGEWLFLKLCPRRQRLAGAHINAKLAARYYGPFQIVERVGAVAYKLKLPVGARVHPMFLVSLLKKAIGEYQVESELPLGMEEDSVEQFMPEDVLATRVKEQEGVRTQQVLMKWTNRHVDEETWEDMTTVQQQFPEFNLEEKVVFLGGGVVRDHVDEQEAEVEVTNHIGPSGAKPWLVYSRRVKKASHTT